jgi:patatin-like phospholipase/acyl hydrolase
MASTASPSFFPPYSINQKMILDGGVIANNPSKISY